MTPRIRGVISVELEPGHMPVSVPSVTLRPGRRRSSAAGPKHLSGYQGPKRMRQTPNRASCMMATLILL